MTVTITGQTIPVSGITVAGTGGATTISTDGGSLQLLATVLPANATNKTVTWSITSGSAYANIGSSTGILTAIDNGSVTVRATATDGSNVYGSMTVTITGQIIPVSSITVSGAGGVSLITSIGGTLQLSATILPANATNQTLVWSMTNGTGQATINSTGLVTAMANGTVTARAEANDGSGVFGTIIITISNQIIPVSNITLSGGTSITSDDGILQLSASLLPANATDKTVTWSISSGTDKAYISIAGLVTALDNGIVIARATANDGSGVYGTLTITISNQVIPVTSITVTGTGGATTINNNGGTLQLIDGVLPVNATNKTVSWSLTNNTGQATISSSGLVTAVISGTVTAKATANDGSNVFGTLLITISNQLIPVTGITVTGAGGVSLISSIGGTLQLNASIAPINATNQAITWSLTNVTGQATINSTGLVTAVTIGTVTARATANDGSGAYGTLTLTISNQVILVTYITITGEGGLSSITSDKGTLQLIATILPSNATDQSVTWTISDGTGHAYVSSTGLVEAVTSGIVTVRATANDGSGVSGTINITITLDRNSDDPLIAIVDENEIRIPTQESYLGHKISLYDLYGRLMGSKLVDSNLCIFDISSLHSGMYIIVLSDKMILKVSKVIIP
jgi:uncharacterized protein YjdB